MRMIATNSTIEANGEYTVSIDDGILDVEHRVGAYACPDSKVCILGRIMEDMIIEDQKCNEHSCGFSSIGSLTDESITITWNSQTGEDITQTHISEMEQFVSNACDSNNQYILQNEDVFTKFSDTVSENCTHVAGEVAIKTSTGIILKNIGIFTDLRQNNYPTVFLSYTTVTAFDGGMCWIQYNDRATGGCIMCSSNNRGIPENMCDHDFIQVSSGETHVCGLTFHNELYCYGGMSESGETSSMGFIFTNLDGSSNMLFQQVVATSRTTCGLQLNGYMKCWSSDDLFELTTNPELLHETPYIKISAHSRGFCGIHKGTQYIICSGGSYASKTPYNMIVSDVQTFNDITCVIDASNQRPTCWGPLFGASYYQYPESYGSYVATRPADGGILFITSGTFFLKRSGDLRDYGIPTLVTFDQAMREVQVSNNVIVAVTMDHQLVLYAIDTSFITSMDNVVLFG